jgi:GMP synthase-like glutamine amidotransferase
MKPVAIFRFSRTEGPGYFATFLDTCGIPWTIFRLDAGEVVPGDLSRYSGFVFMGGPMSVNDDLPWNPPILELIREAVKNDQPCLGHCLGGQLISKALGGMVTKNPVKEIGWGEVKAANNSAAKEWLDDLSGFIAFQWHGETFSVPKSAKRILVGAYCENQAFVLGKHLGMQCHIEMTAEMIETWCRDGAREIEEEVSRHRALAVQNPDQIRAAMPGNLPGLNAIATKLYEKWVRGLEQVAVPSSASAGPTVRKGHQ